MGTVAAWILHKKSAQARQVYPPANTQGNDQTGPCACRKHFNFPFPMHLTLNGGGGRGGGGNAFHHIWGRLTVGYYTCTHRPSGDSTHRDGGSVASLSR